MKLHQAASHFDKLRCIDAYDAAVPAFYGQLDLFDDSKRDGVTVTRRVLSVDPSVALPARRAVDINGTKWVLGTAHVDVFLSADIRTSYVIQQAQGLLTYQTVAQALSTGGTQAYGARLWTKDMKEVEVSSNIYSFYTLFFAQNETVQVNDIVTAGGRMHRVRNVYLSAAGLLAAEANELASDALVLAVSYYGRSNLNPVTDVVTEGTPVSLNALRMRFQDDYLYANQAVPKFEEGDIKVFVLKSAVATAYVDDQIAFADGRWKTVAIESEGTCWGLHMRHA